MLYRACAYISQGPKHAAQKPQICVARSLQICCTGPAKICCAGPADMRCRCANMAPMQNKRIRHGLDTD